MCIDNYQHMTTIGFFGDSFCAGREPESWCVLLAEKLNARIVHWGEPGRSIWTTIMKFNKLQQQNRLPDICVFCWTEPYRLYHPNLVLSANTEPIKGVDPNVYRALDDYWKYLHSYDKDELAYEYALKWFDQNVLSNVDKKIIQMWSFRPFETADKDAKIKLLSGTFIDESMFAFSKKNGEKDGWGIGTINHMTTKQNEQWADRVYERIKS
jgi:hypothetical protein